MSSIQFTDDDMGKQVVISDGGDQIGIIQEVRRRTLIPIRICFARISKRGAENT